MRKHKISILLLLCGDKIGDGGQGYDVFSQKIQEAINNGEVKVIIWDSNVN